MATNKWDDEEDSDVKENWDDDDEEPVSKASSAGDASQQKPPTTEPKEPGAKKKKQKALKDKLLQKDLEMSRPRTKEELLADKLERQRLQEESDLSLAKEAFGVDSNGVDTSSLGSIQLATRTDFEVFRKALNGKLSNYTRSPYYVPFLEELFRELATDLEADDIKKLDTVLTTIFNEKIKLQKVGILFCFVYKDLTSNLFSTASGQGEEGEKGRQRHHSNGARRRLLLQPVSPVR